MVSRQLKSIQRTLAKAQDESSSSMVASQFIGNKAPDKSPSDSGAGRQEDALLVRAPTCFPSLIFKSCRACRLFAGIVFETSASVHLSNSPRSLYLTKVSTPPHAGGQCEGRRRRRRSRSRSRQQGTAGVPARGQDFPPQRGGEKHPPPHARQGRLRRRRARRRAHT
jgi:hypothetical protein